MGDQIYTDSSTIKLAGGTHTYDRAVQEVKNAGDPSFWQSSRENMLEMVRD